MKQLKGIISEGKVIVAPDKVFVNVNNLVMRCDSTRSVSITLSTYSGQNMIVETPSSGILKANGVFSFPVSKGDKITAYPENGDWTDLRSISAYEQYLILDLDTHASKFNHCEYIGFGFGSNKMLGTNTNHKFPYCKNWFRGKYPMPIVDDTFSSEVQRIENSVSWIDIALLSTTYTSLTAVRSRLLGSVHDIPIKHWGEIWFDTCIEGDMTGDIGQWMKDMNAAGYGIGRGSTGSISSDVIVPINNYSRAMYTTCTWNYIKIDISTAEDLRRRIRSLRAIGTIPSLNTGEFSNEDQLKEGIELYNSIVDGDLGTWRMHPVEASLTTQIVIHNSRIVNYTKDPGTDGVDKIGFAPRRLIWHNCAANKDYNSITYSEITEQTLVDLIDDKHYYVVNNNQENGYFYVKGYNPAITDQVALYQIEHLITPTDETVANSESPYYGLNGYGWTISHN